MKTLSERFGHILDVESNATPIEIAYWLSDAPMRDIASQFGVPAVWKRPLDYVRPAFLKEVLCPCCGDRFRVLDRSDAKTLVKMPNIVNRGCPVCKKDRRIKKPDPIRQRPIQDIAVLSSTASELDRAYWLSSKSVTDLAWSFGFPNEQALRRSVQPAQLKGYHCVQCNGSFYVENRRDAQSVISLCSSPGWRITCDVCSAEEDRVRPNHAPPPTPMKPGNPYARMPYREYLQTPEWRERRHKALLRAKFSCQVCCSKSSLNVHHRTYVRVGDEDPGDLIVLCEDCHGIFHREGKLADRGRADWR